MTNAGVIVPYTKIDQQALLKLVEEFVTRDGTDYGESEIPTEQKVAQVLQLLKSGRAVVVFDPESDTATILMKDDPRFRPLTI